MGEKFDNVEKGMLRGAITIFIAAATYSVFSGLLNNQLIQKQQEATNFIDSTNQQINMAKTDNQKILTKTNEYSTLIQSIEEANNRITDRNRTRNAIPNLLNQIMMIIPESVQLTSIENSTGTHVVINAQSDKYEQLGYLKAKIKTDVILTNVISTAGQKDNNIVTVKIEGDLP